MAVTPAEIQSHLRGLSYPVSKDDLIEHARGNGADEEVINALEDLPQESFNSPSDVSQALGEEA